MRFIKPIFDFYLNSSMHVGIEVCCFVLVTCLQFEIPFSWTFIGFVFFGTVTGYNFIKYASVAKFHHKSLSRNLRTIQLFSLFCFLTWIFFAIQLSFKTLAVAAFFGLFTIFYTAPFLPDKKNLRNLHGAKIFIIALVVSGLTILVPLVHHEIPLELEIIWIFLQRMTFIIAVIIPFEIRDMDRDVSELGTIPQQIGSKNAKVLGVVLVLFFLGLELLRTNNSPEELISAFAIALIAAGFILISTKNQSSYYASFWVESISIFWFLIYWSLIQFFP